VKSILNPDNSPSESRRKWYNQITGTEDAWADPRWVDANRVKDDRAALQPGDRIVMFGDGSKSGDDTGLVGGADLDGVRADAALAAPDRDGQAELVNRTALDAAVTNAFDTYKVVAFYFDPSHAKADDAVEDDRFWWPLVDDWHRRYSRGSTRSSGRSSPAPRRTRSPSTCSPRRPAALPAGGHPGGGGPRGRHRAAPRRRSAAAAHEEGEAPRGPVRHHDRQGAPLLEPARSTWPSASSAPGCCGASSA
jgi:hypothetical protein